MKKFEIVPEFPKCDTEFVVVQSLSHAQLFSAL